MVDYRTRIISMDEKSTYRVDNVYSFTTTNIPDPQHQILESPIPAAPPATNTRPFLHRRIYKTMSQPSNPPITLLTVNTAPDRAKRLIGRMIEALKDSYNITHVDNCTSIDQVAAKVREYRPDVLVSDSQSPPVAQKSPLKLERGWQG